MLNLKELVADYNRSARSFAELLPWFGFVAQGQIINLDGSLLAGFEFSGIDIESTDIDYRDKVLETIQRAYQRLDERFTVWSFLERRCKKFGTAQPIPWNPVVEFAEQVMQESVDDGTLAELRHTIWVAFNPIKGSSGFFDTVGQLAAKGKGWGDAFGSALKLYLTKRANIARSMEVIDGSIQTFEGVLADFFGNLSALNARRLVGEEMALELLRRSSPATEIENFRLPREPYYLSTLLAGDTMRRHDARTFVFDGATKQRFAALLAVKGWPGMTDNTQIELLCGSGVEFVYVSVFRFLDQEKAKKYIQDAEAAYRAATKGPITKMAEKIIGFESDRVDNGQLVLAEDAQEALTKSSAEGVRFGFLASSILVLADTIESLDESVRVVTAPLTQAGAIVTREVVNGVSAFCTFIPGQAAAVTRWTMASVENLADLTPVRTVYAPKDNNAYLSELKGKPAKALLPLPTDYGVWYPFNFHVDDLGHFLCVGPSGAGKTTFINLCMLMWQRYHPCRLFVLDKNYSCAIPILSMGGKYIDLSGKGAGGAPRLNPMKMAKDPKKWMKLERWLEMLVTAFGYELRAEDSNVIRYGVAQVARYQDESLVRLGSLYTEILGRSPALAAQLQPWCEGGRYGALFDNEDDSFELSDIVGTELGGTRDDPRVTGPLTSYIMMTIDEKVVDDIPTMIYFEEGWYLLKDARFAEFYEDFLKTMRKRAAICGVSTQSLDDLSQSSISSSLLNEVPTRIFLPNENAEQFSEVYEMFGLSKGQIELLTYARRKRDYLITQGGVSRLVSTVLPQEVLALTRSDPVAKAIFGKHFQTAENNESWAFDYIKEITA